MKILKTAICIALTLCFTGKVFAHGGENTPENVSVKYLSNQVIGHLSYPDFILGQMGNHTASILFKVDEKGRLLVEMVETETPRLAQYIEKLLDQKKMYVDQSLYNQTYRLQVTFR